ncbi:Uncharacterised protein [uncultured archaeon]|nr:Uncharacterised protein [uncultured archaeon]
MIKGSKGSFTPEHFVGKIKARNAARRKPWRNYLKRLAVETAAVSGREKWRKLGVVWDDGRNYANHYSPFFSFALSKFLRTNVTDMAGGVANLVGKPTIQVLEDGVGRGAFLSEFKPILWKLGLKAQTTGLYVERKNPRLEKARGQIDELQRGLAEYYVPKKKFDLFVSLAGSIQETLPAHQVNKILKFASAMNPRGLMLVGLVRGSFDFRFDFQVAKVKRVLMEEGFRAEVYKVPSEVTPGVTLPNYVLVAQRGRLRGSK